MFPAMPAPWLNAVLGANPVAYAVVSVRFALYGTTPPEGTVLVGTGGWSSALIVALFAALALTSAVVVCSRRR
jgi:ABC-type polysaccharide/polyol phosphate export permease